MIIVIFISFCVGVERVYCIIVLKNSIVVIGVAAGDRDVSIAGGVSTLNAYLAAGLLDELRLHVVPFTVGEGLRVFEGVPDLAMDPVSARATPHVTHLVWRR